MLEQVRFLRTFASPKWSFKDSECVVEPGTGAKITDCLSGLRDARIIALMAAHTDVVRQSRGKLGRVDDGSISWTGWFFSTAFPDVQLAGTMAIFTTNGCFLKRFLGETHRLLNCRSKTPHVTLQAGSTDRSRKTRVISVKARRQIP